MTNLSGQLDDQYLKMQFVSSTKNEWIKVFSPTLGAVQANATYSFNVMATWDAQYGGGSQPSWAGCNVVSLYLNGYEFYKNLVGNIPTRGTFNDIGVQVVIDSSGKLVSTNANTTAVVGETVLTGGSEAQIKLMGGRAASTGGSGQSYVMFDNVRLTVDATKTWDALGDGNWTDGNRWVAAGEPLATENIEINAPLDTVTVNSATATAKVATLTAGILNIAETGKLTVVNTLMVAAAGEVQLAGELSAATLNTAGTISGTGSAAVGTLKVTGGSVGANITASSAHNIEAGTLSETLDGASATLTKSTAGVANFQGTVDVATIAINAGTANNSGSMNAATVNISGGTLDNSNTLAASTALNVNSGTLTNSGSVSAPVINVAGGALNNTNTVVATTLNVSAGTMTSDSSTTAETMSIAAGAAVSGHYTITKDLTLSDAMNVSLAGAASFDLTGTDLANAAAARTLTFNGGTATLSRVVSTSGLVSHVQFDGTMGPGLAGTGGTAVGAVNYDAGKFGLSAGVATYGAGSVVLNDDLGAQFGTTGDFSMSLWMYFDSAISDPAFFSNKSWDNGNNTGINLAFNDSTVLDFNTKGSTGTRQDLHPAALNAGAWNNIVFTVDRDGLTSLYVNGVAAGTLATSAGSFDGLYNWTFLNDGTGVYSGTVSGLKVDEYAAWSRLLTGGEVAGLYDGIVGDKLGLDLSSMTWDVLSSMTINLDTTSLVDPFMINLADGQILTLTGDWDAIYALGQNSLEKYGLYMSYDTFGSGPVYLSNVPEPATMSLLVLGGVAALLRRRRS
ncbi:MAG: PEP-CTERM sorting domain-containing protein [Phycisphaerae bacterium]